MNKDSTIAIPADPSDLEDRDITQEAAQAALLIREFKRLRSNLGLSQEAFAKRLGLKSGTLRDWEQGRRRPDATGLALIRIVIRNPGLAEKAA